MATHSSSSSEQPEDEDISLSDLPHIFIDPDQTTSIDPDKGNVFEAAEEEFEFGASMRGSTFLTDTKMCAADELFFKGQILPLRLSVSSDNGLITKLNATQKRTSAVSRSDCTDQHGPCHMSSSFKSRGSSTGISPNSSRSNSNSSTSTDTTNYTRSIASSKPKRVADVVRNQFYAHPSPKPQIQISNGSRLENVSSRRSKKSSFSIWDFFRLGLVRTPEQDLSKVTLRSNSARVTSTRISVGRNSSVNSNNNSTPLSNNNINDTSSTIANATICNGENGNVSTNSTAMSPKSEKKSVQKFYNGCKCAFDDVVSSNAVVPKGNVDKEREVKHEKQADKAEKVKVKKNNGNNKRKQVKQNMSHQRTYEWLKGL